MPVTLAAWGMGTRFEVVLIGGDERSLSAAGEAALAEVAGLDARLSAFRRDSLISHLNRTGHIAPVTLDGDLFALFERIDEAYHATGGAFDPTVGPLMRALGFRGGPPAAPDSAELAAARARVGWRHVRLDRARRTVAFDIEGLELDLGGVAKGFALDLLERSLRESGVTCALAHGGTSSVLALAAPPGAPGWRVEIAGMRGPLLLANASLSVSARQSRRTAPSADGDCPSHVLDPRSGQPVADGPQAVSRAWVVERDTAGVAWAGTRAECWSTAIVAGATPVPTQPGPWAWARQHETGASELGGAARSLLCAPADASPGAEPEPIS